uniref:G_PROTEIN_RECEP_F1_2 domain-containing protein n=1 Tax=Steinernema glaseri TaxID=37863 RepID=A0A1I7Z8G1_9BILA
MEILPEFNTTNAAFLTGTIGLLGLVTNIVVAIAVRKSSSFGYAFGTLCLSQTIADIGMCATFVFMTSGISLIEPSWHSTYLGRRSGQLLIFFWEGSIFTHLFSAVNRAIAINFPLRYNAIFGNLKVTRYIVLFIWTVSAIQASPYFIPTCSMLFDPVSFTYAYGEGLCGDITENYADKITSITVVTTIGTLDFTSFLRLVKLRATVAGAINTQECKRREVRFFFQACAQSSLLMSTLVFFFYLVYLNEDPWYVYITTTLIWMLVHCLDGAIIIVFNREVRRIIRGKLMGLDISVGYSLTNQNQTSNRAQSRPDSNHNSNITTIS